MYKVAITGTGHVSGAWVTDQAISREPGLLPYIYVDRIDDAIEQVEAQGGEIVKAPYPEGNLWVATFRDPCLGYFVYLFQNQEGNDHAGNLIPICPMHEWRRKGAGSVITGTLFGTDVSSSQYNPYSAPQRTTWSKSP